MKNKILAGFITLALACSFAVLRAEDPKPKAKTDDNKPATEAKAPMYMASCPAPCEFTVRSHDRKEVAAVLKEHAKSHHHMDMSDKDAEAKIKERIQK